MSFLFWALSRIRPNDFLYLVLNLGIPSLGISDYGVQWGKYKTLPKRFSYSILFKVVMVLPITHTLTASPTLRSGNSLTTSLPMIRVTVLSLFS
jgi:hypothetical protein